MEIKKAHLTEALEFVKPGLANRELIQQSTSFAFVGGSIVTYNDEISVKHPFTFGEKQLNGAIRADEFYTFLKKVKQDTIELEIEGAEVKFKSGRIRAGFTMEGDIVLPIEQIGKRSDWCDIPPGFIDHLNKAMGATGRDISRLILTAVNITKEGALTGSDSYKIMHCVLEEELPVEGFLLPARSAVEIVKLQPKYISEGKGWIHFKSENDTEMSCRTLIGEEYPPLEGLLDFSGSEFKFPETINELIDRASAFYKRDHILDESISITIADNRVKVKARSETGWMEEKANLRYNGDPIVFEITPYLLKDILNETQVFHLGDRMIKFEGEGWTYVARLRG